MTLTCSAYLRYSAGDGSLPIIAATAASSADARYTLAPLPSRLGKLRVDVDTTVVLSPTRACKGPRATRIC